MIKLSPVSFAKSLMPAPGVQRRYILSSFLNSVGTGMFMPVYVLYFTRIVDLPLAQIGLAFTISGLLGIPVSIPAGDLADRWGPRRVVLLALLGQGLTMAAYLLVRNFWSLLVIDTIMMLFTTAFFSSVGALLRRVGGEDTVTFRSKIRTLGNIGISIGALVAGVGIQFGTSTAYHVLLLANAASFLVACIVITTLPNYRPLPRPEETPADDTAVERKVPRWIALRDKPFLAYALVGGLMSIQNFILEMMFPLWIVAYTFAPSWGVIGAFVVNTVLVALLQVRLGDKVQSIRDGGSALRKAGIVLMLGCVAMSLMRGIPAWGAVLLLVVGTVCVTLGEIWYTSGTFALEFGLPPEHAQGQYQGVAGTVTGLSTAVAPILLLGVALSLGRVGWYSLAAFLLLLGLVSPAIAAWGQRTRPAVEAAELKAELAADIEPDAAAA
ncbi:MAG TPA: MFS transporter [Pseudonocardiaceae bacterium]|nr:MFS transporter [Pseudonocardiaceae bacterium]